MTGWLVSMKYYSERHSKNLRSELEKRVLLWSDVQTKKMFGSPCYEANRKLFTFLVANGIVITRLGEADREKLARRRQAAFFRGARELFRVG